MKKKVMNSRAGGVVGFTGSAPATETPTFPETGGFVALTVHFDRTVKGEPIIIEGKAQERGIHFDQSVV